MKDAYEAGLLGKNILGSGVDFDIHTILGAGAYICGEETALMESLEGKKGLPRFKPPFPAAKGVWGMPATTNTTETVPIVPFIIQPAPEWVTPIGHAATKRGPNARRPSGHDKRAAASPDATASAVVKAPTPA